MSDIQRRSNGTVNRREAVGSVMPWWAWAGTGVVAASLLPFWLLVVVFVAGGFFLTR